MGRPALLQTASVFHLEADGRNRANIRDWDLVGAAPHPALDVAQTNKIGFTAMNKMVIAAAFVGIMLIGAGSAVAEETRTVEWYLAPENAEALDAKIRECRNNPGELQNTPNCINARQAFNKKATSGRYQKVEEPPIPKF